PASTGPGSAGTRAAVGAAKGGEFRLMRFEPPSCPHHRPSDAPIGGGTVQPTANGPDPTLAEGEGFEPPRAWRPLRFSRPLRSTTPASLRGLTQPILWATAGLPNRADAPRQARR